MVLSLVDQTWNISSSHSCCLDLVVLYNVLEISSSIVILYDRSKLLEMYDMWH